MTEPTLVVDLGTATTAAAIVAQQWIGLLRDPLTGGYLWPSAMCLSASGLLAGTAAERRKRAEPHRYVEGPRRAVDAQATLRLGDRELTGPAALTGYLSTVATEANAVYGEPIRRLTLTAPAGYAVPDARREVLLAVGAAAGFADTELLADTAAVALDPGTAGAPGDLVLVCDLGSGWTIALVRVDADRPGQLAHRVLPGGRELDAVLVADLRAAGRGWVEPLLAAAGDAGLRAHHETVDFVRRLKHRLGTVERVSDHLTPMSPAYGLDRQRFAELAGPAVRDLVGACHEVLAEAGTSPADLAGVVLAGGGARLPGVAEAVADALGHEPRRTPDPEFAAVRGAARWAAGAQRRRIPADPPRWREEPVAFAVPSGARILHRRGPHPAVTAHVRGADDLVYSLVAPVLTVAPLPPPGTPVGPVLTLTARRPAAALAADPPPLLHRLGPAAAWHFDAAAQVLLGYTGDAVRTYAVDDAAVLAEFRPETTDPGRLVVGPDGRPVLITWGTEGVAGWDVGSGKLAVRLPATTGVLDVLVDEPGWRLAVESPGRGGVGRYRRSTVTVWDLSTGERVETVRGTAFAATSDRDGLATSATAPDGELTAVAAAGRVSLAEHGTTLFRTVGDRTAFTADGRHLLIHATTDTGCTVDVHAV